MIWNMGGPRNPGAHSCSAQARSPHPRLHLISLILAFFSQKLSQIPGLNLLGPEGGSFPGLLDTLLINLDDPLLTKAS